MRPIYSTPPPKPPSPGLSHDTLCIVSASETVQDLWRQQSIWSGTANRMKRQIGRSRTCSLLLTVAAGVLGALAGVLSGPAPTPSRVSIALAAFAVATLPILRPGWSGNKLRDWTRARSVSEGLKSEIYLWLARAGEYADDPDGRRLLTQTAKIRADGADLLRYQHGIVAAERSVPAVNDLPSYFAVRVKDQIDDYYRAKAARLHLTLRRFRAAEICLAVLGAVIGATAAATGGPAFIPWIAVLTTVTAALAVHVAATRYDFQLIEFLRTADRLEHLHTQAATAAHGELSDLAIAAEQVISIENESWMAKLAEDPPVAH
jgi:hypothetical protein